MKSRLFAGRFFAIAAGIMLGLTMLSPLKVSADSQNQNIDPVQISPVCSTASDMTATWSAYNKNTVDVTFNWLNKDTGVNGSFTAPANNTTDFKTNYQAGLNNQTEFTNEGSTSPVDRNATNVPCSAGRCVDGSDQANLISTKVGENGYSVQTKNSGLLCGDITVYASSYTMPANFDGNADYQNGQFVDSTAYPQTKFDSTSAVLKAGTNGLNVLTFNIPDRCNNIQTDLYYGPEITTVGATGHGGKAIDSNILRSTGDCQTGGNGGGPTTPSQPSQPTQPTTPSRPVGGKGAGPVATAEAPATTPVANTSTLSDTGTDSRPASIIAALLLAAAVLVATRRTKVTQ